MDPGIPARIAEENAMEFPQEDITKKETVVGGPQAKQASWKNNFLPRADPNQPSLVPYWYPLPYATAVRVHA
jgi:hypothetical protein